MLNDKILSAATSGDTSELKVLLGTATDPNVKDPFGWTPLMWAASMGFHEAVRLLAQSGADRGRC